MSRARRPRKVNRVASKQVKQVVALRQAKKPALRQRAKRAIQTDRPISYRMGQAQSTYRIKDGKGYLEPKVKPFSVFPMQGTFESVPIKSFDYDTATMTLKVQFWKNKIRKKRVVSRKPGDSYLYFQVPFSVYVRFLSAGSKGRFFYNNIRGRYPFKPL